MSYLHEMAVVALTSWNRGPRRCVIPQQTARGNCVRISRALAMTAIVCMVTAACVNTQGGSASRPEGPTPGVTTERGPATDEEPSGTPDRPCTLAGCFSGVRFDITALQGHEQPVTIDVCVNEACKTLTYPAEEDLPESVFVELEEEQETGAGTVVEARLVATGPDDEVIAEQHWERVPLDERVQPNGPDCPPTCWVGMVRLQT